MSNEKKIKFADYYEEDFWKFAMVHLLKVHGNATSTDGLIQMTDNVFVAWKERSEDMQRPKALNDRIHALASMIAELREEVKEVEARLP